ncbi:MAG TPA: transporter substrate-binding domain-containing protein [Chloroflexia bacterium]|nr:transporter substrate-binding domain-containing protein [Chloroflexia bacterium]
MRKTGSTLLVLVAVVLMAACGGNPPAATSVPATAVPTAVMAGETPTAMMAAESPTAMMAAESPTAMMAAETPSAVMTATTGPAADTSLAAIKQRGKLIAGVKYDVRIFGYLNPETNKVEGFDVDLAKAVAKRIFGDENAVEFQEAISANRIPYLNEGKVDVIFSTMTANEDRAKQIEFSDTYYVAGQSLLVPVNSTITSVKDLAGKKVGTVSGSTSEKNIRAFAPEATVELFSKYGEAVQAMDAGRVDVVTTDDIILLGFAKDAPDKFKVVGGQFTQEPYAAGIKKGNTELLAEVNGAIRDLISSGEYATLYKKWIGSDPASTPPQDWREVYKTAPVIPTAMPVATGTP